MEWFLKGRIFLVIFGASLPLSHVWASQTERVHRPPRTSYDLRLDVDVAASSYWGEATVRYFNASPGPLPDLWFLLYPNLSVSSEEDASPSLFIREVRIGEIPVNFRVHRFTALQVVLPSALQPGESVDIRLGFFGRIRRLDSEITGLTAHFTEQISQVIGSQKYRAYWNPPSFKAGERLVLSDFYPMVARRRNGVWQTSVEPVADDVWVSDVADYSVEIKLPEPYVLYTSGELLNRATEPVSQICTFQGKGLRRFMVIAGPRYQMLSRRVGTVDVRSVFLPENESVGRKVLEYAANALSLYQSCFGFYPYASLTMVESPLPAGWMSAESSCLIALSHAYYVDFQAANGNALPTLIRENAGLIEDAVEFNIAYSVGRQWWGMLVGVDPERAHFLDNALATHAALLYYEKNYSPEVAEEQKGAQLVAAYRVYRMFGGEDKAASQPIDRFTSNFQYTAIVHVKGALFFEAIRKLIGDETLASVLKGFFRDHSFGYAHPSQLLNELRRASPSSGDQINQLYKRWMTWRHGDQDIAPPDYRIIVSMDMKSSEEERPSAFQWLGRFIAKQMTRVGKYAAKPFEP